MQYRVYITALQYGCEIVEAESEDEARQEAEKLFKQHRIFWHDEEITDISPEEVLSKAVVVRLVGGITLNGELEFLLDDSSAVLVFDSPEQARSFLTAAGVEPEELRHMTFMESCGTCRKCGSPLFKSLTSDYDVQCFICDEDFYQFEQDT